MIASNPSSNHMAYILLPRFSLVVLFLAYCETKSHIAHAAASSLSVTKYCVPPSSAGNVGVHPHNHTLAF